MSESDRAEPEELAPGRWRPLVIAVGYGAVAGAVAALALALMNGGQDLVWSVSEARWYVFVAICIGGILLALLRGNTDDADLQQQIKAAADPRSLHRRRTALLAVSAIIAVGFGGAIGPEAGLIAIVSELSALVSLRITRSQAEARAVGEAGNAAVLSGLYGSPPGAAAYDDDTLGPGKLLTLLAAIAGLVGFLVVYALVSGRPTDLGVPSYPGFRAVDLALAVVPAVAGAAVAAGYVLVGPMIAKLLQRPRSVAVQTLLGTLVFAALATAWPVIRFSGHHEFGEILTMVDERAWLALAGVAVLKLLATAVNLATGWRGGAIFPLLFAGAAAGAATLALVPGLHPSAAIVAGMGAATTIGMRKPLAVLLICAFILHGNALIPLAVGVGIGLIVVQFLPEQEKSH
ncbi:chloride channel protein [Enemella evansiae]|uniref:chloride channel protein n=1 Tax=Enemella evansiae TaxID=2016499 RepID=UPI00105FA7D3|nr:chloride channel protein [Enemella evansiae]TDO89750.1 H+/Cl- antiporter ClcA [Enemella evansiae]